MLHNSFYNFLIYKFYGAYTYLYTIYLKDKAWSWSFLYEILLLTFNIYYDDKSIL